MVKESICKKIFHIHKSHSSILFIKSTEFEFMSIGFIDIDEENKKNGYAFDLWKEIDSLSQNLGLGKVYSGGIKNRTDQGKEFFEKLELNQLIKKHGVHGEYEIM